MIPKPSFHAFQAESPTPDSLLKVHSEYLAKHDGYMSQLFTCEYECKSSLDAILNREGKMLTSFMRDNGIKCGLVHVTITENSRQYWYETEVECK